MLCEHRDSNSTLHLIEELRSITSFGLSSKLAAAPCSFLRHNLAVALDVFDAFKHLVQAHSASSLGFLKAGLGTRDDVHMLTM